MLPTTPKRHSGGEQYSERTGMLPTTPKRHRGGEQYSERTGTLPTTPKMSQWQRAICRENWDAPDAADTSSGGERYSGIAVGSACGQAGVEAELWVGRGCEIGLDCGELLQSSAPVDVSRSLLGEAQIQTLVPGF